MLGVKIVYDKKVKLHNPILFAGLPGIGSVGSLVVQYLIQKLNAKEFAQIYSSYLPHIIIALPDGGFRLVSNRLYYYKDPKTKKDYLFLTGDYQPATSDGQYALNEEIVKFFKKLGGKELYTIGGYTAEDRYIEQPRVFGVSKDRQIKETLKKAGVIFGVSSNLSIIGSAGMLVAFADLHKMRAACIMGETGMLEVDANSAKSVLQAISKAFGLKVDLSDISALQKETERIIKELENANKPSPSEFNYIK